MILQKYTICPGSSDPFHIVSYYIKWTCTHGGMLACMVFLVYYVRARGFEQPSHWVTVEVYDYWLLVVGWKKFNYFWLLCYQSILRFKKQTKSMVRPPSPFLLLTVKVYKVRVFLHMNRRAHYYWNQSNRYFFYHISVIYDTVRP